MTEFFACEHPMHVKYVVSGRGIVCTKCDPTWQIARAFDIPSVMLGLPDDGRRPDPMTDEDWADTES